VPWSPDGRWLCVEGDTADICSLGPRFSTLFFPLIHLKTSIQSGSILNCTKFPEYCSRQPNATLLQQLIQHSWDVKDICPIVQHNPLLLCAVDSTAGSFDDWRRSGVLRENGATTSVRSVGPNALTAALSVVENKMLLALIEFLYSSEQLYRTNFLDMIGEVLTYTASEDPYLLVLLLKKLRFLECRVSQLNDFRSNESLLFSSYYSKFDNWKSHCDNWKSHYSPDKPRVVPVMVPLPRLGSLKILSMFNKSNVPPQAWNNDVMDTVLRHLWLHYIRKYFLIDFALCLTFCILWVVFLDTMSSSGDVHVELAVCILMLNIALMFKELRCIWADGFRIYFGDFWNIIGVSSFIVVNIVVVFM